MRILIATDYYPPFIGGGHRALRALAHDLSRAGHEVTVATIAHPDVPADELDEGVAVHRLPHLQLLTRRLRSARPQEHHPPFPDPLTVVALRRLIRRERPDVAYAYGWIAYSLAIARAGTHVPLVLGAHDYGYACATRTLVRDGAHCAGPRPAACLACAGALYGRPKGWLAAAAVTSLRPLLRRSAAGVHAISRYVAEVTRRDLYRGQPPETLVERVIPSFSEETDAEGDAEAIARVVSQLPAEPFVLFVGALRRVKGIETLLDAYASLGGAPPLVLLGTVESDTPARFPPGVVVIEDAPHGAVMQAWGRCLFGVAPSLWPEPLGLVVHEGMSRARAVIGTQPGGHADLIADGDSGLLVPPGDPVALARAMRRLLDEPAERSRFGAAAAERAAGATAEATRGAYDELLRAVSRPSV